MRMLLVVAAIGVCGCASMYPARAIAVRLGGAAERRCIDRALTLSRGTGYVEQTIDKDTGFFRVFTRTGRAANGVYKRGGVLRNFNVACLDDSSVLVTPVGDRGILSPSDKRDRLTKSENNEIREYAAMLGMPFNLQSAPEPPQPARVLPPPTVTPVDPEANTPPPPPPAAP